MKRGSLLRNYAHVFAVMMRLRQLCCHKNLLPVDWSDVNMEDLAQMAKDDIGDEPKENAEKGAEEGADEETKRLAEQLRQMIRDGMSDECSICLSEFDHPVITQCAHVYCRPCITQYIEAAGRPRAETQAQCPLCRMPLSVDKLLEAAPDDETEDEIMDEAEKMFEDIIIDVSSTKVNAVMKELAISKKRNPREKTIVVSQFTSLLSILQPLMTDEGYRWTRLDGSMNMRERSSVIADFQDGSDKSATILLLSLRAGK